MSQWDNLANDQIIKKTAQALSANGIETFIVENGVKAKEKALELIPQSSEILTMTSVTLDTIGLSEEINKKDGKYKPVRDKLYSMDAKTQGQEMKRLGSSPAYAIGSVHAVTEEGQILVASATGSQLPAYSYGSTGVLWVVGGQKIVKNVQDGIKRIYEHVLPLESERARKAYGVPGSSVNKILIINKEFQPGRIKLILVKEKLGF
ncbi:MAG: LUD domain-containing protein [Candidatus Levybacteria bacterium]|nr:LUD domain-containing protein [Candidatus Levybacteria bacterium]